MPGKIPTKRKTRRRQADDFESVARRLGCDEDKDRFEAALGKIAKTVPNRRKRQSPKRGKTA